MQVEIGKDRKSDRKDHALNKAVQFNLSTRFFTDAIAFFQQLKQESKNPSATLAGPAPASPFSP
jgi:hypothetical protein